MDPLSVTAGIIAVLQLSAKVLGYLNDVKDASKDRAKCAVEASNVHSLLLDLRFRLEEGSADAPWYTAIQAIAVENGPLDQFKQALEALQNKMTDGGRLTKVGEALIWKFKKEEIASISERIERLKTLVQIALQMDHFKLSQAIKDDTSVVRTYVPAIRSGVDKIQEDQADARHSKIVEWISHSNYPAQQSDTIGRRQKETGQWFLHAPEFARWLGEPKSTLFCPGIPGAGKTIVAAIAIDYLLKSAQSSSIAVAYVYCNYKDQEKQDASSMLAAIIKQLVQARPSLAESVERLHKQHVDRGTKPSPSEIFSALREVVAKYSTVYVVIDALDECQDSDGNRRLFLARLRDLQVEHDIRLMTTSRFIPEVEVEFKQAERLEVWASNEDVQRFVAGQMYRLPKCIQRDPALQKMVEEKISERVDGMFLLARLYIDSLLDKTTAKKVKTTLANLSKGSAALDDAYKDALQRIKSQLNGHYDLAKKVLSWITYARRPLTTAELCCALAVEPEEAELDPDNLPDIEDLLSVCAGLVVIDQESAVIRLVHYTTQEYFERMRDTWNPDAPLHITLTCLTYLSFDTFRTGSCSSDKEFEKRVHESKFLDYAAKYWGEHAIIVESDMCALICSFLSNSNLVSCATQAMLASTSKYLIPGYSQRYPKESTGLHLAARFGLSNALENILSNKGQERELEQKDSDGETLLHLAAGNGHYTTTQLLLDKGADVNAQGGLFGSALQAALLKGHETIVKLLLEKGADVNAQGGGYSNALQAASFRGHETIIELLLEKGADVNAQSGDFGNALQTASFIGNETIVELLLRKGADVNAQSRYYGSALQAASLKGHETIVKLLLKKGADINAQGKEFGSALQTASFEGHETIVKLLLKKGADINAQGGQLSSALQAASFRGHETIVELLLKKGADINVQGGNSGSALQGASSGGYETIVELLLEKGADVNTQGGHFGSALQGASCRGHETIVELLLEKGADVNAQGGAYGNALQAALEEGHETIVKLLLEKGADVNAQGGDFGSALQVASSRGDETIVKLLLEKGADVNAQGGDFGSALQVASSRGDETIVKLLLEKGADVNAQGGDFGSALQAASCRGYKTIVELLLEKGANINAQGGDFGSALQAASSRGDETIVKLLLEKGADVNAQSGYFDSALQAALDNGDETIVKLLLDAGAH